MDACARNACGNVPETIPSEYMLYPVLLFFGAYSLIPCILFGSVCFQWLDRDSPFPLVTFLYKRTCACCCRKR